MNRFVRPLFFAALAALGGCILAIVPFDPTGSEVSVRATWMVNGVTPTQASCDAAGIARVRVMICENASSASCVNYNALSAPCSAGMIAPVAILRPGKFAYILEGLSASGALVQQTMFSSPINPTMAGETVVVEGTFTAANANERTIAGSWQVNGEAATAASCLAANIANVRLRFYTAATGGTVFREFMFPCQQGSFDSRTGSGPTLPAGMYYSSWEALHMTGTVLAATPTPYIEFELSASTHGTLAAPNFQVAPPVASAVINLSFGSANQNCAGAMIVPDGWSFIIRRDNPMNGPEVTLQPAITSCVSPVTVTPLEPGTYYAKVSASGPGGVPGPKYTNGLNGCMFVVTQGQQTTVNCNVPMMTTGS